MHAGQNTDMRPGAIWACVIPMGLGVLCLATLLRDPIFHGSFRYSIFPISFLLVAPLSAWLACRRLRRLTDMKQLSRWRSSFFAGLGSTSLVQLIIAAVLTCVLLGAVAIGGLRNGEDWSYIIGNSLFFNALIWVNITLPLTAICATIFWRVTKFPDDRSVF